jgi:hypothetical protein
MKLTTTYKSPETEQSDQPVDHEKILVNRSIHSALDAGVMTNHVEIVNFYVSLKSKPLAILVGPKQRGKNILVRCFAQNLIHNELHNQFQSMLGHPWWIERSENHVSLGNLHSQFNAEKLRMVTDNAGRPENEKHIFIACLNQISSAEVNRYFLEISRQLQTGRIIHLQETSLPFPFIYPHNLLVIGTIDTASFNWYDEDLLAHTSIIQWQAKGKTSESLKYAIYDELMINGEEEFLCSRIRNAGTAHLKIQRIFGDQSQALKPLLEVESVLLKYGLSFSTRQATSDAVIYLSNAWTSSDAGLFDHSHNRNLKIALDFAITQNILTRGWELIRQSASLRSTLGEMLNGQFPNSKDFLQRST